MRKTISTFIICLLALNLFSQIEAVTENADTIIVLDNGTWKNKTDIKATILHETSVNAEVKIDDFTNSKSIETDMWQSFGISGAKTRLSGCAYYYKDGYYSILVSISDKLGCMSKGSSTLSVKLSNDEVIEFIQVSKTSCKDFVVASFIPVSKADFERGDIKNLIKENVETLKQFDWVTIRIRGTEYHTDITPKATRTIPNPEQFFRQHFTAIDNKL